jgi:hypothetical protein
VRPRHVVAVAEGSNSQLTVALSKAPISINNARKPMPLGCDPATMPPLQTADGVRLYGAALYDRLMAAHPAINQVLTTALGTPNDTPALYFHLLSDEAERFSWESLYEQQSGFLALQREWPIARMADSSADISRPPAVFDGPLRVLAVLSAHNVPADQEWQRLRDAVTKSRAANWPVTLRVLIGEEPLFEQIETEIADLKLSGISAIPVPQTPDGLKTAINEFAPHILHFFAHGAVGFGAATLQMAHFGDAGKPAGSVVLAVSQLLRFKALEDVWLVTLNCCDTGRAAPDMHSMAHRLVADGVPAALGMMEPIAPQDAHSVCGTFYGKVFEYLATVFSGGAPRVEIEWSQVLYPIRSALRDLHLQQGQPESRREWTLPVLYVRPERRRRFSSQPAS